MIRQILDNSVGKWNYCGRLDLIIAIAHRAKCTPCMWTMSRDHNTHDAVPHPAVWTTFKVQQYSKAICRTMENSGFNDTMMMMIRANCATTTILIIIRSIMILCL